MTRIASSLALLLTVSVLLAGCGSTASDAEKSDERARTTATSKQSQAKAARKRVAGTQAATTRGGFLECIHAAGFVEAPPGHGVAAQWVDTAGTVIAISTDLQQMSTIAAQFSTASAPATILPGGVVLAGTKARVDVASACVKLR
ncbi:MAG: hypothetical protein JWN41_1583 [Thermoleophilia bacterium]|nr:hypothetical protein [Thermoleophilia bacterium]